MQNQGENRYRVSQQHGVYVHGVSDEAEKSVAVLDRLTQGERWRVAVSERVVQGAEVHEVVEERRGVQVQELSITQSSHTHSRRLLFERCVARHNTHYTRSLLRLAQHRQLLRSHLAAEKSHHIPTLAEEVLLSTQRVILQPLNTVLVLLPLAS